MLYIYWVQRRKTGTKCCDDHVQCQHRPIGFPLFTSSPSCTYTASNPSVVSIVDQSEFAVLTSSPSSTNSQPSNSSSSESSTPNRFPEGADWQQVNAEHTRRNTTAIMITFSSFFQRSWLHKQHTTHNTSTGAKTIIITCVLYMVRNWHPLSLRSNRTLKICPQQRTRKKGCAISSVCELLRYRTRRQCY